MLEVGLSGQGSSVGPQYTYVWTSLSGDPVQDWNTLSPTVFAAGWYELAVTNEQNGCQATAQAEVVADAIPITGFDLEVVMPSCFGDRDGSILVDTVFGGSGPFLFSFEGSAYYPARQFHYLPGGT